MTLCYNIAMAQGKSNTPRITNRVKQFCLYYSTPTSETFGNGTASYKKAGFRSENAQKSSHMLLKRPEVASYLADMDKKTLESYNWNKEVYIKEGIDTIRELPRSSSVRSKYYEIVGKVYGFFNDNVVANVLFYNNTDDNNSDSSNSAKQLKGKLSKLLMLDKQDSAS